MHRLANLLRVGQPILAAAGFQPAPFEITSMKNRGLPPLSQGAAEKSGTASSVPRAPTNLAKEKSGTASSVPRRQPTLQNAIYFGAAWAEQAVPNFSSGGRQAMVDCLEPNGATL
jgi:hypothetical protein